MKTYEETVTELAEIMYHRYMSGSNEYYRVNGLEIVCFIYGKETRFCFNEITAQFQLLRTR